jgi:hypothetical protein
MIRIYAFGKTKRKEKSKLHHSSKNTGILKSALPCMHTFTLVHLHCKEERPTVHAPPPTQVVHVLSHKNTGGKKG